MPLFNDTITLGVRADLTQFERDILNATAKASARLKPLDLKVNNGISQPLGKITGDISQFSKSLDAAAARVLAFSASVGIINGVVGGFRALIKETIAVEKALTDINSVLNTNKQSLDNFSNSLFDIARNTSQSFKAVTEAALEFSRQGLSVQETLKRTNDALILSRISGLDAAESVKTLTAAINGFNKEALDTTAIVNRLANVDSSFAVSSKDLADALTRVGSTADDANVSFNELLATVTAVQQTTSRGGAVIGNALKTIFTRLSRESTITQLRELGVAIDESSSGIQKLQAVAKAIEGVDKSTANTIKELAGGVFQINVVSAALGDLSREYSVYGNALKVANASTDEASKRNAELNKTLAALATQAGANIDQLAAKIGKISFSGNLKTLFAGFNSITKSLSEGLDGEGIGAQIGQGVLKGIGNFLTGPAAALALGAFAKLIVTVGKDAFAAFRSVAGITSEADKQKVLQDTIGARLAANAGLYEKQLLSGKGISGIQQQILADLTREAELRAKIASIAPQIARDISPFVGVKKGSITPKASEGIIPAMVAERRDVMAGVGGASASSRPVFVPRFNYGDRVGPLVANTSEKIVENFMGSKGSAVLNKKMIHALGGESKLSSYGKVRNVADGYVPNMASYEVAGGKVNLRKRGKDIVLDEILGGFDSNGDRLEGTGIVRKAFDLAIEEGKKMGANSLIVDVLNSRVAKSLNGNSKFSGLGPFSTGKIKIPLMGFANGHVPSFNSSALSSDTLFAEGFVPSLVNKRIMAGKAIGEGDASTVFENPMLTGKKGLPELVFKKFKEYNKTTGASATEGIRDEFSVFKYMESLGLPVTKAYGSLGRSQARGGIVKEKARGFSGDKLRSFLEPEVMSTFREDVHQTFEKKGIFARDLHSRNYTIDDNINDLVDTFKKDGYNAFKNRALSKIKIFDGDFAPNTKKSLDSFNKFKSSFAGGFVPSMVNSPLRDAVNREASALVSQGFPKSQVASSIRVDTSPLLSGPKNPSGLGVFNTLQGQNSISKAFSDHAGQSLKNIGSASGHIPNLVGPFDPSNTRLKSGKFATTAFTDALNQGIVDVSQVTDTAGLKAAVKKIKALQSQLAKDSVKAVDIAVREAFKEAQIESLSFTKSNLREFKDKNAKTGTSFATKETTGKVNDLLRTAASTTSQVELGQVTKELGQLEGTLTKTSIEKVKANLLAAQKLSQNARANTAATSEDIFASVQKKIGQRGFFGSFAPTGRVVNKEQGFAELPPGEQNLIRDRAKQEGKLNRRQNFERASLGLAFAGSLATPFIDSAADSLRSRGNNVAAGAASTASGALTGASFGAILGPQAAAVGALAGGLVSLGKALDGSASNAEKAAKAFDELQAKTTATINGFGSYIQTQQKLDSIIEEGGKEKDIAAVRQEMSRIFSTIADPEARKNIIATSSNIKDLGEAFAKTQSEGFGAVKRQNAVSTAANEKDKNTTFFGVRSQSTFSSTAIGEISRSLIGGAPEKSLKGFSAAIKDFDGNVSKESFVSALEGIKVAKGDAISLFNDLENPLNRLLLLRGLKENLNFAEELEKATESSVRYKKSLTDLNKTIGALTALNASERKLGAGVSANAFGVQQNGAQLAASLKFITASPFAQSQLSTAFQSRQNQFQNNQERESTVGDLVDQISGMLQENRTKLKTSPDLVKKLDSFVDNKGQGVDINALSAEFSKKGLGSGENLKAFTDIGLILKESSDKLSLINDNERSQEIILRQSLAAQKEKIATENKINLLGGAEGQINFASQGFDRFKNRDISSGLSTLGGQVGAFGRNENAQGIIEFQKSFGGVQGLDVRKIIPNAENIVATSIKESLIEGFGRLNIPVNGEKLKEINSISQLSAAKTFEKRELTAAEIGEAVGQKFNYDAMANGNEKAFNSALISSKITEYTSSVPEIRKFLESRLGLERDRTGLNEKSVDTNKELQKVLSSIDILRTENNLTKAEGVSSIRVPAKENLGLFSTKSLQAADLADRAAAGRYAPEFAIPSDISQLSRVASQQVKNIIPSDGSKEKFRQNINDTVNDGNLLGGVLANPLLKSALLTQFPGGFEDKNGKREINNEAFAKILSVLEKNGAVAFNPAAQASIDINNVKIAALEKETLPLREALVKLTENINNVNAKIEAKNANLPSGPNATANAITTNLPAFTKFASSTAKNPFSEIRSALQADIANAQAAATRKNVATFGELDKNGINNLRLAKADLGISGPNAFNEAKVREAQSALLRQAQNQQLNLGQANPELQKIVGSGSLIQNSRTIADNTAKGSFDGLVNQANEAFLSGFANSEDMTRLGIKISQGLEDYTRAQIKLGFSPEEARRKADELREEIQKRLGNFDIKLPKTKLEEFGQGFTSAVGDLQKSFDDLGSLGAKTATDLTNGFGDAFFDIVSGAKSAKDAVGGLLASIAADLSKFFFKRAIAGAVGAAIGTGVTGTGSFAKGGLMRLANGGASGGVPALVMKGERIFSPDTVKAYGEDFFHDLNAGRIQAPQMATGGTMEGMVTSGSGYKDDVFGHWPKDTFVLQKSAVSKYGNDFLTSIEKNKVNTNSRGGVQKAFFGALLGSIIGGAVQGAVVGGVTAKITGGDWKKGALMGGIAGGIGGGISGFSAAGKSGSSFGSGFKGTFGWTGLGGNKSNAATSPSSSSSAMPSADSLKFDSKFGTTDTSLAGQNGGFATGVGNQSLTSAQTAVKPSAWKTGAMNLGVGTLLALASSAMAPKQASAGSSVVKGNGVNTTYNSDGSVAINTISGTKVLKPGVDFRSMSELQSVVAANGGNVPADGVPRFAEGGIVSGEGSVIVKDKSELDKLNKQFDSMLVKSTNPVPSKALGGMLEMGGLTDAEEVPFTPAPFVPNNPAWYNRSSNETRYSPTSFGPAAAKPSASASTLSNVLSSVSKKAEFVKNMENQRFITNEFNKTNTTSITELIRGNQSRATGASSSQLTNQQIEELTQTFITNNGGNVNSASNVTNRYATGGVVFGQPTLSSIAQQISKVSNITNNNSSTNNSSVSKFAKGGVVHIGAPTTNDGDVSNFNSTQGYYDNTNLSHYVNGGSVRNSSVSHFAKGGVMIGGASSYTDISNMSNRYATGGVMMGDSAHSQYFNSASGVSNFVMNEGSINNSAVSYMARGGQLSGFSPSVVVNNQLSQGGSIPHFIPAKQYAKGGIVMLSNGGSAKAGAMKNVVNVNMPDFDFPRPSSSYITQGSGMGDDVNARLKRNEFILNDKATEYYGTDVLHQMNSMAINKQDIAPRGVLTFSEGGTPMEARPSDRDKGLFSVGSPQISSPSVAVNRGGASVAASNHFEININLGQGGSTTVSSKSEGEPDQNGVDAQKFASKVKALFDKFVETESRAGGSLNKNS